MDSEAAVLIGETQPGDDVWETGREGFDAGHDLGSGKPLNLVSLILPEPRAPTAASAPAELPAHKRLRI